MGVDAKAVSVRTAGACPGIPLVTSWPVRLTVAYLGTREVAAGQHLPARAVCSRLAVFQTVVAFGTVPVCPKLPGALRPGRLLATLLPILGHIVDPDPQSDFGGRCRRSGADGGRPITSEDRAFMRSQAGVCRNFADLALLLW